jgi:anti-anti-sigma factor
VVDTGRLVVAGAGKALLPKLAKTCQLPWFRSKRPMADRIPYVREWIRWVLFHGIDRGTIGRMPHLLEPSKTALGRITVDVEHGERVLRLAGEIDSDVIETFLACHAATPTAAGPDAPPITAVDLAEVTFLSSAGLSFLVRQTQAIRRHGSLPVLRGVARPARRAMEITGVTTLFRLAA